MATPTPPPKAVRKEGGWAVLYGDWTALVRDWADLVRIAYLAGAAYAFVSGANGHGVRLLVTFAVALTPRWLKTPRPFDLFFTLTIGLQAWGNLAGLFHNGDVFDRLDHALSTFGLVPLFYLWFVHLGLVRHTSEKSTLSRHIGLLVVGSSIGLAIGAIYEIYEYIAVTDLGATVFINEADTAWDLMMDGVGAAAGSLLLLAWVMWGWGTERRAPGRLRFSPR